MGSQEQLKKYKGERSRLKPQETKGKVMEKKSREREKKKPSP